MDSQWLSHIVIIFPGKMAKWPEFFGCPEKIWGQSSIWCQCIVGAMASLAICGLLVCPCALISDVKLARYCSSSQQECCDSTWSADLKDKILRMAMQFLDAFLGRRSVIRFHAAALKLKIHRFPRPEDLALPPRWVVPYVGFAATVLRKVVMLWTPWVSLGPSSRLRTYKMEAGF